MKAAFALVLALGALAPLRAEIPFIHGPAKAPIGDIAEIQVPEGWQFVPKEGMEAFDKATENLYDPSELGVLMAPKGLAGGFWAFFAFDDIGYIKDAAAEKLDPVAMWQEMKDGEAKVNEERAQSGFPTQELVEWLVPPAYNAASQRLEWAYRFKAQGQEVVNYNTRILGRYGVMKVTLVPMGELTDSVALFNEVVKGFDYKAGSRYGEYVSGDKVAKAGLAALVLGGAAAAAASSGLLGKFWQLIVAAFLGLLALLKGLFHRLSGRKDAAAPPPAAPEAPAAGEGGPFKEG